MFQYDEYKNRVVKIHFNFQEKFTDPVNSEQHKIILITNGQLSGTLNKQSFSITSPTILCLSKSDTYTINKVSNFAAQSFYFQEDFFDTNENLEDIKNKINLDIFKVSSIRNSIIPITNKLYPKIFQWFSTIGTEVFAHSDNLWVCRIKQNLIQLINLLRNLITSNKDTPVSLALDYIHTNYFKQITLDDVAKEVCVNRVTLNKLFHKQCESTVIAYLITYRLKIASDLLLHTGMTISEIAQETGFNYDTYFMKKFNEIHKMSPTQYRRTIQKAASHI